MMRMRALTLLMMVAMMAVQALGQRPADLSFQASVKSIDEFMARFNGQEHHLLNDASQSGRRQDLLRLYDALDTTNLVNKLAMVDTILQRNTMLSYNSKMWYAEASCKMTYHKRDVTLSLMFRTEQTPDKLDHWALVGADGLTASGVVDVSQWLRISPTDHEVNFMSLESMINIDKNRRHFAGYRSRDIDIDQLSAFIALVQSGDLVFDYCQGVKYHFLNVPNFIFIVENYFRENTNSGWLISDVIPADRDQKEDYLLNTLKLKQWYLEGNSF